MAPKYEGVITDPNEKIKIRQSNDPNISGIYVNEYNPDGELIKPSKKDFECLKIGMTYTEVKDIFGTPDKSLYTGFFRVGYELDDGTIMVLDYTSNATYTLKQMSHINKDGSTNIILSSEEKYNSLPKKENGLVTEEEAAELIKQKILEDRPNYNFINFMPADLTTYEMFEKMHIQSFEWNYCLYIIKDGEIVKDIYNLYDDPLIADLDKDGNYELYFVTSIGSGIVRLNVSVYISSSDIVETIMWSDGFDSKKIPVLVVENESVCIYTSYEYNASSKKEGELSLDYNNEKYSLKFVAY